jgi:arylsulfatase A-like enzyme
VQTDLYASFAALLGQPVPEGAAEDSVDAHAIWLGADLEEPPRTSAVHHSLNGHFAFRSGRWKLIEGQGSGGFTRVPVAEDAASEGGGQLYDLRLDPGETTNLWDEQPEVVTRLRAELAAVRGDD